MRSRSSTNCFLSKGAPVDDTNSLVIEFLGLKATALGAWPVTGLLALIAVCFVVAAVAGPAQIGQWVKRLAKLSEK